MGAALAGRKRNYGVDLLRIVAMLYVLILHVLGQGGILSATTEGTASYAVSWYMEIWAYCAVDVFALISGFVAYSDEAKKTNYANMLVIWLQAVFYNVLMTLVFLCMKGKVSVTGADVANAFFPVFNGAYWYLTAYVGLFFLMPFLNYGLSKISASGARKLFVLLFLAFCVFDTVAKRFVLNSGYSFIWVTLLYVMGAVIKKCEIGKRIKPWMAFIGVVVCVTVAWVWKLYGPIVDGASVKINRSLLVSYTSPCVAGASIFYLIGFSKLKIKEGFFAKTIAFLAPGAFAAYLLNCQKYVWTVWMKGTFAFAAGKGVWVIVGVTLGFSVAFVLASILIDRLRILLFDLLRVKKGLTRFVNFMSDSFDKLVEKLSPKKLPQEDPIGKSKEEDPTAGSPENENAASEGKE